MAYESQQNIFIERSLIAAVSFFKETLFAEYYASKKGLLQCIDPRIKTFSILAFLISANFIRDASLIAGLYALCILLSLFSRIDFVFFMKRTWVFIPLFSLVVVVPAVLNVFHPGETLVRLFSIAGHTVTITKQGVNGAVLFMTRVITSVSCVILLGLTTRYTEMLKVLRIFKVPQIFVLTLGMCYRYIYLFVEIIENTYQAMKSRVGRAVYYKKGQRMVTWSMAHLWQRAYHLHGEVYDAMLSRGYTGEPQVLSVFKTTVRDWVCLAGSFSVCGVLLYFSHLMKR